MPVRELIVKHDRYRVVFLLELVVQGLCLVLGDFKSGPAIPLEGGSLGESAQTADQSSRGHGHVVLALIGALDGDGQSIRHEQQTSLRRLGLLEGCGRVRHLGGGYVG